MAASYSQTILWKATFLILLANFCESISDRLLEEAVKVIGLYQDQQSFDLKPESKSIIKTVGLSAREKALGDQYETTNQSIGDIESQIMHIRPCANIKVDESQAAKIVELETKKSSAIDAYLAFYNGMKHELLKDPDGTDAVPSEKEVKIFQSSLEAIGIETKQNTTGLYTLIGDRNFHLVTVFPDRIMSFVTPIKSDNFEKKIWEFYELLQSDEYDTRILGKELYDIILKPAEAELKKHRTQTLLWSLDGKLRYVPMSALSPNGLTYLASQYQSVNFTRSETGRITKPVSAFMNGTGFGSSKAHTVAFGDGESIYLGALRSMNGELMGIFKNPTDDAGFVTGALFTDEQFTKANFFEALRQHRPLVHISSHFVFREGDDEHSFLLLGDGTTLTLSEMKRNEHGSLFEGVELLTLSACDTAAVRADSFGKEIDGFAELAQRLGANAVMATLWQVDEESTAQMMEDFYKHYAKERLSKSLALQESQIDLISGTYNGKQAAVGNQDAAPCRGGSRVGFSVESKYRVPFKPDNNNCFSHPYYWSPFVLFGNWK